MTGRMMNPCEMIFGRFADESSNTGYFFLLTDEERKRFAGFSGLYGVRLAFEYHLGWAARIDHFATATEFVAALAADRREDSGAGSEWYDLGE